ncbi:MAG: IclR family transcriptional regulator, partial [Nitriliruptorales bacterium]
MSNGSSQRDGPQYVRSVDRALAVLEHLAERGWSGVTDVAENLDIHKSTAFRLLATLERRGMVEQHGATSKYRLGSGLARLASSVNVDLDLRRTARPACERLAEATHETVNLAVMDAGGDVVHIDQVVGAVSIVHLNWLGRRTPAHCTASGKILLAHAPDGLRRRVLSGPLEALTPNTVVDANVLEEQLERARRDGHATTVEELEVGLNAVAAPIRAGNGDVIAALVVSGPAHRLPTARLAEFAALAGEAAEDA